MHAQTAFPADPEYSDQRRCWQKLLPYTLLLSVTLALYAASLFFGFVWDDLYYITENYRIHHLDLPHLREIWTRTYMGHYAPVQHTLLAVIHGISGANPFAYHLAQVVLHAICVCLVYSVMARIETRRIALVSALLFAVYPANIETVAWVSETKSTLAFLFFLLSFRAYLEWRRAEGTRHLILCAVFFMASVLAKINTVVAPAIFALYEYWQCGWEIPRKRLLGLAALFSLSGVFVIVHLASFHGSTAAAESAYYGSVAVHLLNLPFLVFFYLRMAIVPYPLSAWHMFRIYDRFTWEGIVAWIAFAGLLWMLSPGRPGRVQFWGMWFLVFLAPVLQIVPFPIWVADRYLYIPAIGIFVLGNGLLITIADGLSAHWQRLLWQVAACAIVLAFAAVTWRHLPAWKDDLHLWTATLPTCSSSPYCHLNLGESLLQAGQTERGIKELIRAVEIRRAPRYLIALGDAYTLHARDYRQALIAYKLALDTGRSNLEPNFYARLARLFILIGKLDEAEPAIQDGRKLDPNDPALLVVSSFLEWKRGNLPAARTYLERAMAVTGETSVAGGNGLLAYYWGDAAAAENLLSDLRGAQGQRPAATQ